MTEIEWENKHEIDKEDAMAKTKNVSVFTVCLFLAPLFGLYEKKNCVSGKNVCVACHLVCDT